MRRDPCSRGESGFTLLEVMVAFIIAAMASIILYEAGFNGAAASSTAARYQEAVVRAQSRLASIGTLTPLRSIQASGDDGSGFKWRLSIAVNTSSGQGLSLYDVQVTEAFGTRSFTLATSRLGPTT